MRWAASRGVVMLPGVASATEIEAAMDLGLTTLKFFPAEPNGGLNMLKVSAVGLSRTAHDGR